MSESRKDFLKKLAVLPFMGAVFSSGEEEPEDYGNATYDGHPDEWDDPILDEYTDHLKDPATEREYRDQMYNVSGTETGRWSSRRHGYNRCEVRTYWSNPDTALTPGDELDVAFGAGDAGWFSGRFHVSEIGQTYPGEPLQVTWESVGPVTRHLGNPTLPDVCFKINDVIEITMTQDLPNPW